MSLDWGKDSRMSTSETETRHHVLSQPAHSADSQIGVGAGRRLDAAHQQHTADEAAQSTPLDQLYANVDEIKPVAAAESTSTASGQALLLQANQLAEYLKEQTNELHRREQALILRLNELDHEKRNIRLWVRESEEEVSERESELTRKEQEFAQRSQQCEQFARELELQEQQLHEERARLRDEIALELQEEREKLKQEYGEVAKIKLQLVADREAAHFEQQEFLETARKRLEEDRTRQKQVYQQKLEEEFAELSGQKTNLEQACHELKLQQVDLQHALNQGRSELEQERLVFEKRIRFQQDHLAKARQELEQAQKQQRSEAQLMSQKLVDLQKQVRLRNRQLNRRQQLIEEKEKSLQRQIALIDEGKQKHHMELQRDQEKMTAQNEAWAELRRSEQAEIQRQQSVLALHADNLEARKQRLDKLRAELEETHRTTLEMRMAMEEAWAQFTQTAGDTAAQQRVEAARARLEHHYQEMLERIRLDNEDLDQKTNTLRREKNDFFKQRETLTNWISERDDDLRTRERELQRSADELDTREAAWRATRDRWMNERIEAEQIIRNLLDELESHPGSNVTSAD